MKGHEGKRSSLKIHKDKHRKKSREEKEDVIRCLKKRERLNKADPGENDPKEGELGEDGGLHSGHHSCVHDGQAISDCRIHTVEEVKIRSGGNGRVGNGCQSRVVTGWLIGNTVRGIPIRRQSQRKRRRAVELKELFRWDCVLIRVVVYRIAYRSVAVGTDEVGNGKYGIVVSDKIVRCCCVVGDLLTLEETPLLGLLRPGR